LRKLSLRHHRGQIAVGRRQHPRRDRHRLRRAHRTHLLLLQRAQQFGLQVQRQLADLVEKDRPTLRRRQQALPRPVAPVKAPFTYPKSSLSINVGTSDPQSTGTNGFAALGPLLWIDRATSSLPVPLSPRISTGWVEKATFDRMR
jgi:hypothetical protein